jgi:hypothetical protein
MKPVLQQVLESATANWLSVENKEAIEPEWWLAFSGTIPLNPELLGDIEILALAILALQDELHGYKLAAGEFDQTDPGSEPF